MDPFPFRYLRDFRSIEALTRLDERARLEIRNEIAAAPSERAWSALMELLCEWPGIDNADKILRETDESLADWDPQLRRAPADWRRLNRDGELAPIASLLRVCTLRRHETGTGIILRRLADSPYAERLERLEIHECSMETTGVRAIVDAEHLPALNALEFAHTVLSAEDVAALFLSTALPALRHLRMHNASLGDDAIEAIPDETALKLDSLDLSRNVLRGEGVAAISAAPWAQSLRALSLRRNLLEPGACETLAGSPNLRALEWLDLSANRIDDPGTLAQRAALRVIISD